MKNKTSQAIRAYKNTPMKSPSPDYNCSNKSKKTTSPFKEVSQFLNNKIITQRTPEKQNNQKHIQPVINSFHKTKKNAQRLEQNLSANKNRRHQVNNSQKSGNTNIIIKELYLLLNKDVKNLRPTQEITQTNIELILNEIRHAIQQLILKTKNIEFDTFAQDQQTRNISQLQQIEDQKNLIHKQLISTKIQLQNLKNKLKNQEVSNLTPPKKPSIDNSTEKINIRSYLYKNSIDSSQRSRSKDTAGLKLYEQGTISHTSSTTNFLKEKIKYLEKQLQSKSLKITKIEEEKNFEISRLQEKLNSTNYLLQTEMESLFKIIESQKFKIQKYQSNMPFTKTKKSITLNNKITKNQETPIRKLDQSANHQSQDQFNHCEKQLCNKKTKETDQNLNNLEDYGFKECFSQQEDNCCQTKIHQREQQLGKKIRDYYQDLLQKNSKTYKIKLDRLTSYIKELKINLIAAIDQCNKKQNQPKALICERCLNCQNPRELQIQVLEAKKRLKIVQKQNQALLCQKKQYEQLLLSRIQENNFKDGQGLFIYKQKLLRKLNRYITKQNQKGILSLSSSCLS